MKAKVIVLLTNNMIAHFVNKNALYLLCNQDVCCTSEDKELLYSAKTGFKCCGHLYYNTSLWSCCAERLGPEQQPGHHRHMMVKG